MSLKTIKDDLMWRINDSNLGQKINGWWYSNITNHRSKQDIRNYENEAFEKVWLMRTRPCDNEEIEAQRQKAIERILNTYDDIPEEGYDDWECGYWNGIMGALRWVLGEEKDMLDT